MYLFSQDCLCVQGRMYTSVSVLWNMEIIVTVVLTSEVFGTLDHCELLILIEANSGPTAGL